jgi:hypothetical protein
MALNLSIAQMLAKLDAKVAHHEERKAFHAEQELIHRDQTAVHAAELEASLTHREAFRAASLSAGELLERDGSLAKSSAEPETEGDFAGKRSLSRMVAKVLEGLPPDQTFGARAVTRELQERWGAKLRRRPDPRSVAATLRRWGVAGRIHQVREGRAYNESLYRKAP